VSVVFVLFCLEGDVGDEDKQVLMCSRNHDGTIFAMYYKGTVKLTPGVLAILSGSQDAKTTEYGMFCASFFERCVSVCG
jgi:hypothetical protein